MARQHDVASVRGDLAESSSIRLWDGYEYDRAELMDQFPELLEFAEFHPTLEERNDTSTWVIAKNVMIFSLILSNGFFGTIIAWSAWSKEGLNAILMGMVVATLIGAICGLLKAIAWSRQFSAQRPNVVIGEGRARLQLGIAESQQSAFDDLEWYVGRFNETTRPTAGFFLPWRPAIVLVFPELDLEGEHRVAVGHGKMYDVWYQFLTATGRLRRTAWEISPFALKRLLYSAVGVLIMPLVVALPMYVSRAAKDTVPGVL